MPYAVNPNPTAAILENDGVGQRSGTSCVCGSARSQKKRKLRRSTSSSSAASEGVGATARCRATGAFAQAASSRQRSAVAFRMKIRGGLASAPKRELEIDAQADFLAPPKADGAIRLAKVGKLVSIRRRSD